MELVRDKLRYWQQRYPNFYEFMLFKTLSNIATLTNFICLWLGRRFFFVAWSKIPFDWMIFHYGQKDGGLSGFLAFLFAYICAQTVNFIVQRKLVFAATIDVRKVLPTYIMTVSIAGIISIWLPPYVIEWVSPYVGTWSMVVANIVNIVIQVLINYPMLKFVIMRKKA